MADIDFVIKARRVGIIKAFHDFDYDEDDTYKKEQEHRKPGEKKKIRRGCRNRGPSGGKKQKLDAKNALRGAMGDVDMRDSKS